MLDEDEFGFVVLFECLVLLVYLEVDVSELVMLVSDCECVLSEQFPHVDEGGLGEADALVEVSYGGIVHGEEVVELGYRRVVLPQPV